ncbi:hypothetical protein FHG87_000132 [Trinorchestia longiramus]|nr:hypothetical protein FHG87_000132 [Trinorchestia longiramus]
MRPVPHSDDLPVSKPPANKDLFASSDEAMFSEEGYAKSISSENNVSVYSGASDNELHWITQEDLTDLASPFGNCQVQPVPVESLRGLQRHWAPYGYASGLHKVLLLWGSRSTFAPGEHSVQENSLVDMNKVFFPPLQIKLGLMKNFVKAMDKNGTAVQHLLHLFPALSSAKLKKGIFVEPQIREVLKDKDFEELLTLKELRAWDALSQFAMASW